MRRVLVVTWIGFLAGCTSTPERPTTATDPSNPDAEATPERQVASVLAADASPLAAVPAAPSEGAATQHNAHRHGSGSGGQQRPVPDHQGATTESADDAGMPSAHGDHGAHTDAGESPEQRVHTCPMHPEVRANGPGRCPKCGMALKPTKSSVSPPAAQQPPPAPKTSPKRTQTPSAGDGKPNALMYTCPMHPEVQSAQPGKCPKCGMKLMPKKAAPGGKHESHGGGAHP